MGQSYIQFVYLGDLHTLFKKEKVLIFTRFYIKDNVFQFTLFDEKF